MRPFRLAATAKIATAVTFLSLSFATSALAQTVYPLGVRLGVTPLVGLAKATNFAGFQTSDESVRVIVSELPVNAFNDIDKAFRDGIPAAAAKTESIETGAGRGYYTRESAVDPQGKPVLRYSLIVPGTGFSGYMAIQVPENAARIYSDDAVRQMFASATIRQKVPVEEQLSLMPFEVSDLSKFENIRTLSPVGALLLADGTDDDNIETAAYMVLGAVSAVPERADERARFAENAARNIPGVRNARLTSSEPLRIAGQAGYETRLEGISGKDNTPVNVIQWLRFSNSNRAIRIIGSSPKDNWSDNFPRFREVRDGINMR